MVALSSSPSSSNLHIVEVGETGVLVEVLFGAFYFVRFSAATTAHQVHDAINLGALVIVDMARNDDDGRMHAGLCLREEVAQGDLIWARVVVDMQMGLDIRDGRMVQTDHHEVDGRRQAPQAGRAAS